MTIGENIRYYRKWRGFTLKKFGLALGFPESAAEVRIVQYERGIHKPKKELINCMAQILHVSPVALDSPDINSNTGMMHLFFVLERKYGLKINEQDGILRIELDKMSDEELLKSLRKWAEQNQKMEQGMITKEDYLQWEACYS